MKIRMIFTKTIKTFLLLCAIQLCSTNRAEADIENGIVAIIGSELITKHDLDSKIGMIAFLNNKDFTRLSSDKNLREDIISGLIEETLLMSQAKKLGITVSEEEFSSELTKLLRTTNITESMLVENIKNGKFEKNTLSNFVKYQASMRDLVKNKIQKEIEYTSSDKLSFEEALQKKLIQENSEYNLFIVNVQTLSLIDKEFGSCSQLNNFLSNAHLSVKSKHSVLAKDMNEELFQKIKSSKEKNGFIKYNDNIVGFCTNSESTVSIKKDELENSFYDELIKKAIRKNSQELKDNTFILIKS